MRKDGKTDGSKGGLGDRHDESGLKWNTFCVQYIFLCHSVVG